MSMQDGLYLVEAMSPCEEEIFTKEYIYHDGKCKSRDGNLPDVLESCRRRRIQAVVWYEDKYVGGTWMDITTNRWNAELLGTIWQDSEEMHNVLRL